MGVGASGVTGVPGFFGGFARIVGVVLGAVGEFGGFFIGGKTVVVFGGGVWLGARLFFISNPCP